MVALKKPSEGKKATDKYERTGNIRNLNKSNDNNRLHINRCAAASGSILHKIIRCFEFTLI